MRIFLTVTLGIAVLGISVLAEPDDKPARTERFDLAVREEIFGGLNGDDDKLTSGLKKCDEALVKDPKNAEALVWRGAGRVFQAGQQFAKKNNADGLKLWTSGLKDMDDAVALEPKNVGVRIPRAAVLMPAARNAPESMRKPLLAKALEDFQSIYDAQKKDFEKLGTHPRGELRMGLADALRATGEVEKSKEQLTLIVKEMPESKYALRAKEWLAAKDDAKLSHTCIGCHSAK